MNPETIGAAMLVGIFIGLIVLRVPMVFAIGFSTFVTTVYLKIPVMMMAQNIVKGVNVYSILAVPFFILAGDIMGAGGISKRLIALSNALVGWIRGGLAMVNIVASMFFGGISGSSAADTASIGPILIPMMKEQGYDLDFSTNVTMASSVQGILIPPSQNMIIFSLVAGGVSIGKLFMAGLVPGLLLGAALMIYSYYVSLKRNYPVSSRFEAKLILRTALDAVWGLVTVLIVVFGVITGIFTATESAAVAVLWALFVTFFIYREVPFSEFWNIVMRSLKTLSTILILMGTAGAFGWVLTYLKIPQKIADVLFALTTNRIVILLLMNALLLFLGMLVDMASILLILTPILLPIALSIGMDPVHLGVMMVLNLGIGLLTPPVGTTLFIGSAISGLKIETLAKSMMPFYLVMVVVLLLITFVPDVSLFLPNLLFK